MNVFATKVLEISSELVKTIHLEDAEMLSTYVKHGMIGHYDPEEVKRWEAFEAKLIELAQAVQDYEA
jgi:hypothetical protein